MEQLFAVCHSGHVHIKDKSISPKSLAAPPHIAASSAQASCKRILFLNSTQLHPMQDHTWVSSMPRRSCAAASSGSAHIDRHVQVDVCICRHRAMMHRACAWATQHNNTTVELPPGLAAAITATTAATTTCIGTNHASTTASSSASSPTAQALPRPECLPGPPAPLVHVWLGFAVNCCSTGLAFCCLSSACTL